MAVDRSPDSSASRCRARRCTRSSASSASAPDLDRVLDGIVDLLSEATDCHACFVYLRDGERLRLRAASRIYAHLVGQVDMGLDEGLAGWVARNGHARVHPRPRAGRPAHEVLPRDRGGALPVDGRGADPGAVGPGARRRSSCTPSRRASSTRASLTFLAHTASLVAGAIENARLYEDTRRRVEALTRLSSLSQAIAAVDGREELYRVVTAGVRDVLGCDACQLYLLDRGAGRLELAAADPRRARARRGRDQEGTARPARPAAPPRPGADRGRHDARGPGRRRRRAPRRARARRGRGRPSARRPTSSCARSPTSSRSRSTRPS